MITEKILAALADQNVQDIIDTGAHGGITYWATEPTEEEFAGLPEGKTYTIVEGQGPCFYFGGEREVEAVHYLSRDQVRVAYARLLDLDQQFVNRELHGYILQSWIDRNDKDGIDTGQIDAGAADVIIQLAALGEIRYG
ncbi:hypothetical protein PBI_PAEDORE_74 [Streptomyces phage Paedore]|uniref:Uncharacterized protein n=1 Tax=Streptomyces phage Paedore TaxID=2108134 RepID=A0A2P1JTT3_9CAUD|nr:hypothetical protein KGG91_gp74 [Streptomyces phage Paedore]AVO22557.1 hypothetical protein PBI_PAEDORE_74 [Streptomyces phage Paedore]